MSDDERGFAFKVVVVGDGAVGKTSLIKKYTLGEFNKNYIATLGAQFTQYKEVVEGTPCELFFWDIAGQESFQPLRTKFYKGSKAAIIMFSHEEGEHGAKSLKNVSNWYKDIMKTCGTLPVVLFGNKIDLIDKDSLVKNKEKPTSNYNVDILRKDYNFAGYYLTSALSGDGVTQAFQALTRRLLQAYKYFA